MFRKFLLSLLTVMLVFTLTACGQTNESIYLKDMLAIIETNHGTIKFEFYPEEAPELTKNFAELAKRGYYDDIIFHRVFLKT